MADYPYVLVTDKFRQFFSHMQTTGVPEKITLDYLKQAGFKSSNERKFIPTLKFLGFVDSSGAPTTNWRSFRNKSEGPKILAKAIKVAYKDLFDMYPDAERKDDEAIRNFISGRTDVKGTTVATMVRTFKTLCGIANFDDIDTEEGNESRIDKPKTANKEKKEQKASIEHSSGVVVNLNIQIGVPATENEEIYDKFFASLKKHLL